MTEEWARAHVVLGEACGANMENSEKDVLRMWVKFPSIFGGVNHHKPASRSIHLLPLS